MASSALLPNSYFNRTEILNASVNNSKKNNLYITAYYDGNEFGGGDYGPITQIGTKFIDIVKLYDTTDKTNTVGTILWNDVLLKDPANSNKVVTGESITIELHNRLAAGFVGGYVSDDGYYKADVPQIIEMNNKSFESDVTFTKLKIEKFSNSSLRKVELYT